ncbi:MAG: hypothetical protein SFZ02_21315 [bacterium]|nr:hypothetical protein [bacterium]
MATITKTLRADLIKQGIHAPVEMAEVEIGHHFVKYTRVELKFVVKFFRSLCAEISQFDYQRYRDTGGVESVISDGEGYFVIGDAVEAVALVNVPTGQERYTNKFYGPLFAYTLAQMYPKGLPSVMNVYVTYPWGDYPFVDDLKALLTGPLSFEYNRKHYQTDILNVFAQPESIGGLAYAGLHGDGEVFKDSVFQKNKSFKNGILIDMGGGTLQMAGIDGDGRINKSMGQETHYGLGGQGVLDALQIELRASKPHREFFRHIVGKYPVSLLNDILLSEGWVYEERGYEIDCTSVVKRAGSLVLNAMYGHLKGFSNLNFDHIYVNGGGGSATFALLRDMLKQGKVLNNVETRVNMLTHPNDMIISNSGGHTKTVLSLWNQK